jgi:hypothetical protein
MEGADYADSGTSKESKGSSEKGNKYIISGKLF